MAETSQLNWPLSPAAFSLGARDIHIWTAILSPSPERTAIYHASLSPDERTRAARFIFDRDSRRFIVGRGILRALLGRYLRMEPSQLKFAYSERGKPALADVSGESIHFNLAHSEELAVFAISKIPGIGIDVEKLRPISDIEGIAERFFSNRETKALKALPADQKELGFFNLWTRKEAWLKATGEGIGELLNQVEVSLLPGEPARLLRLFNNATAAKKWALRELTPAPGYLGALAVPTTDFQTHCWSWAHDKIAAFPFVPMHPGFTLTSPSHHEHRL